MRPMLFNTEMVRAILAGKKTVTRRIVSRRGMTPLSCGREHFHRLLEDFNGDKSGLWAGFYKDSDVFYVNGEKHIDAVCFKAPCKRGDVLYVRETWGDYATETDQGAGYYMYLADYPVGATTTTHPDGTIFELPRWKPSIQMPREAARIFLRVKNVRVERLHDITAQGCLDEGVKLSLHGILDGEPTAAPFGRAWDSTIKPADRDKYGWNANPFVWVVSFDRISKEEAQGLL